MTDPTASQKIPCTVGILTKNSERTLARALDSVRDFAEIIICDGSSTDGTLEISRTYRARILSQDTAYVDVGGRIIDFSGVRNQTLDAATQPWFFFLDSDEYLSKGLVGEIRTTTRSSNRGAYWIQRKYVWEGKIIDCTTTYPNRSMRFFAKVSAKRFIKEVHERIDLETGTEAKDLVEALLVPVDPVIQNGWKKDARYIAIEVERNRKLPVADRIKMTFRTAGVSGLYIVRLFKVYVSCRGMRMPLSFELDRHWYHVKLLAALWRSWLFPAPDSPTS